MSERILSRRELNRALLQRQGLLERSKAGTIEMIEQLVGMQAQVPENPYVGLWSRLDGFHRAFWSLRAEHSVATLEIQGFKRQDSDPRDVVEQIEKEGTGLLEVLAPESAAQPRGDGGMRVLP